MCFSFSGCTFPARPKSRLLAREATGSGLDVEKPDEMLVKAQLAASIQGLLHTRNLTQTQAAELLGLPQPKLSRMLHGHFRGVSEAKMMDCITRLGRDVRIVIAPTERTGRTGRVEVVHS